MPNGSLLNQPQVCGYDVESTVSEDLIVERSLDVVQNPMQCLLPTALEMRHNVTSLHDCRCCLLLITVVQPFVGCCYRLHDCRNQNISKNK